MMRVVREEEVSDDDTLSISPTACSKASKCHTARRARVRTIIARNLHFCSTTSSANVHRIGDAVNCSGNEPPTCKSVRILGFGNWRFVLTLVHAGGHRVDWGPGHAKSNAILIACGCPAVSASKALNGEVPVCSTSIPV
jgi:hypothetical protein